MSKTKIASHRACCIKAILDGQAVPERVLADYPDVAEWAAMNAKMRIEAGLSVANSDDDESGQGDDEDEFGDDSLDETIIESVEPIEPIRLDQTEPEPHDSTSPTVDHLLANGLNAAIVISDEIRRKVRQQVKKKFPPQGTS